MPQKKNPDVLEVIKGKTSLAIGMLQGLLATGKDNFIGYNRHSQWSKYLIMDLIEECLPALTILNEIIDQGLIVHKEKMKYWSEKGFIGSTSLVEQLVMNYKIPFRKAKIIVETAIKYSSNKDKITYPSLLKALKTEKISLEIKKKDLAKWQDALWIIKNLKSVGGPGLKNMEKADKTITKELKFQGKFLNKEINKIKKGQYLLEKEINKLIKK
jgi:argininosuccinate lyase